MIQIRSSWLFPLILALILGGLSAWLEQISEIKIEDKILDATKPQYSITRMSAKHFDIKGNLTESLNAYSAWQLPDQKNIFLKDAFLRLFENGQTQYSVEAKQAKYHIDSKQVFFEQGVILNKSADAKHPATEVKTDFLTVDTHAQTAQTSAPIYFRYGESKGSAIGMFYNHKNGKLDLPAKVKALIYHE